MGPYKVIFNYIEKPFLVSSGSIVNSVLLYFLSIYKALSGCFFVFKTILVYDDIIQIINRIN
ncbi:hypothetical protein VEIT17_01130 [Veillonella nakazawae]|uniref:Uncharacterized protein n=1 Tax=Veillonella nakazawae TaxID=2682456 RepID=A0ABN5XLC3_9FIRM|nr:hypothetical protein VEIT17_01130 [Veillonella nakazawae]